MNKLQDGITIQYIPFPEEADTSRTMEAGRFLWPGAGRLLEPGYKEYGNNRKKYLTGLDIASTEEEHVEINKLIKVLEKSFGDGALDPFNEGFWKEKKLNIQRKSTRLNFDQENGYFVEPDHVLYYFMIKGGAFPEIAVSYDAATALAEPKRWFLVEPNDYAEMNVEDDKLIIKAASFLQDLEDKKTGDDMFLVHKALINSERGVTKKTPKGMIYKDLSDYIFGKLQKTNKRKAPKDFIEVAGLVKTDKKKLFVTAYVKDAIYFNFLQILDDGNYRNGQTGVKYGTSVNAVIAYLMNPANQVELDNIKERIEAKWSQS